MDANLEWWANTSFMLGPFPIVVEDAQTGRLRDVAHLEDLRQTHDFDPAFTLRFEDDSTIAVVVGRPDDEGRFGLSALEDNGTGEFTETEDVSLTATWLTEHGFVNVSTSSSGGNGSRLFERTDGWEVRYQRVLGAWTLELKPPHATYVSFLRVRLQTTEPCWHQELPQLITMLTPP